MSFSVRAAVTGLLAGSFLLVGCSDDADPTSSASAASPAAPSRPATSATTPSKTPVAPPAVRGDPADTAVPKATAGPLGAASMPQPAELGSGWRGYVDPGGGEAGFTGNDSWVRERDPGDVVAGLIPVGCAGTAPAQALPEPRNALEGTYRGPAEGWGVSLVLDYATAGEATSALRTLTSALRACGDSERDSLRIEVVRSGPTGVTDRRRDPEQPGRTSTEAVAVSGTRMALLVVTPAAGRTVEEARVERLVGAAAARS